MLAKNLGANIVAEVEHDLDSCKDGFTGTIDPVGDFAFPHRQ